MEHKLIINTFATGVLIIFTGAFLAIGGNEIMCLVIPSVAFLVAGYYFGRTYPKIFLKLASILSLPLIILVLAAFIKAEQIDKQFLQEGISAIAVATVMSFIGSLIGKTTTKVK